MSRIIPPSVLLTTTLAFSLQAHAAGSLTRTFVSSAGSDSNPCTITQPCATFAQAYSVTAVGGIVAALDPGKYGPLTITAAITINGNGWAAITAPAAGNGITVNASGGNGNDVALIGLEIDGAGAGYNGIVLNLADSLTVTNCTLQNFVFDVGGDATTGNGILLQPPVGLAFTITNTTVSNNGGVGINFLPPFGPAAATGVIDHVVATANNIGIEVYTVVVTGGSTRVTISNSIASGNPGYGILVHNGQPARTTVAIDNVNASGNGVGVGAINTPNVLLGRSVITGNTTGILNDTVPNTFYSYTDNRINLNGTDINGALNTSFTVQ